MIITLTGPNGFAIAKTQQELLRAFQAKHGAQAIERADAQQLTQDRLPDLLQGTTLFAPKRLVLITSMSTQKHLHDTFLRLAAGVDDSTTLLVIDSSLDKRTKLYTFLKANSTFKDHPLLSERQLYEWVQQCAQDIGAALDTKTAQFFVQYVGSDQWRLHSELIKLAHATTDISQDAIKEHCEPSPEATSFELLDIALAGKATQAQQMLAVLKNREDPYKLMGLLASQVYAVALVHAAKGKPDTQIAKDSGLHPFVVRKTTQVALRLTSSQVYAMADAVATCDMQLKSTGADPWQLIGIALGKISHKL